jgi:hypothetical protein
LLPCANGERANRSLCREVIFCESFAALAHSTFQTTNEAPSRRMENIMDKLLPRNEHTIERALRILVGLAVLSLVFVGPMSLWGLIGIVPLFTGLIGSCPAYTLLGVSTCRTTRGAGKTQATRT